MEIETVDEAVEHILSTLTSKEKSQIAKKSKGELAPMKLALLIYVKYNPKESGINEAIMQDCAKITGKDTDEAGASSLIIDEVWRRLNQ